MKMYKYLGPDVLDLAFPEPGKVAFKCAYPKEFNDPYELFLTIDPDEVDLEIVAYYLEILGEIEQFPTSCFSRLPNVIPMWAHYARDLKGFVIEVDEEKLRKFIPHVSIDDVDYHDEPTSVDLGSLRMAYETAKMRHTYLLQRSTGSRAYFTKNICWSYEAERRMLVKNSEVTKVEDKMILSLPTDCVTAVIAGPRSEDALRMRCKQICEGIQCEYYEMRIGKSSIVPFFIDATNNSYLFNGDGIHEADSYCENCGEPIANEDDFECSWCKIDRNHKIKAASRNPMRMLQQHGLLEGYVKDSERIRDRFRDKS